MECKYISSLFNCIMKLFLLVLTSCIIIFLETGCPSCTWKLNADGTCINCGIAYKKAATLNNSESLSSTDDDASSNSEDEILGGFIVADEEQDSNNNDNRIIISGP